MNARRLTATLGALALGVATIGIGPAMAQTGGATTNGTPAGSGAAGMPGGAGPAMGDRGAAPARMPATTSGGMGHGAGMPGGGMPGGGMGGQQAKRPTRNDRMHSGSYRTMHPGQGGMGHGGMHHGNVAMMRAGGGQAQNPQTERLNQESLQAARKSERFTPSPSRQ